LKAENKYSKEEILAIQKELITLQLLKGQEFSEERKMAIILEFENLNMPFARVIERIKAVSVMKTYGEVQFSDFIDLQIDDIIPHNVVYNRAVELININQEKFNDLCKAYYGNKLITRAEKEYISQLLTFRELSYTDLADVKRNKKYLQDEDEKINAMRKRLFANKEKLKQELLRAVETALKASGIPKEYEENIIRIEIENVMKKVRNWL
jgi:hypothetical protein